MNIKIKIDNENYVTEYQCEGVAFADTTGEIDIEVTNGLWENFITNPFSYKYENNQLVLDEDRALSLELENEKEQLRYQRNIQCFSYINRGVPWYYRLTEEQQVELNQWYQKWLDVTQTLTVPDKPTWLEEK